MAASFVDSKDRVRNLTRDQQTQLARSRDGKAYDLVPKLDASGKLLNGENMAPEVAAQYGYKPKAPVTDFYAEGAARKAQEDDYYAGATGRPRPGEAQPSFSNPGAAAPTDGMVKRPGASSLEKARMDGMAIGNDGKPYDGKGGSNYQPTDFNGIQRQLDANRTPQPSFSKPRRPDFTEAEKAAGASVSYDPQPGIPNGHGVIGGPGKFFISAPDGIVKDEKGQKRKFASMDEVNAYFGSKSGAPAAPSAPGDSEAPKTDPKPEEDDSYLSTPLFKSTAPAAPTSTAPTMQAAGTAWNGMGGMMPRPGAGAPAQPVAMPAPTAPALTFNPFQAAGLPRPTPAPQVMLPSVEELMAPKTTIAPLQPAPAPAPNPYQYAGPASGVPTHLQKGAVAPAPAAPAPAMPAPTSRFSTPFFTGTDLADGPVPKKPKVFQAAAEAYNPFASRPRRAQGKGGYMPE